MTQQQKIKEATGKHVDTWEQSLEGLRVDMEMIDEGIDVIN